MNISLNGLWTNTNILIGTKITESLTPIQKKIAIIAIAIFALAAVVYLFKQFVCKNLAKTESSELEETDNKEAEIPAGSQPVYGDLTEAEIPVDRYQVTAEIVDKDARLDPSWINDNPNTALTDLGLDDFDKLKDFITEHGAELKCLNLKGPEIDNDQFGQLIKSCPHLTHLFIDSKRIEDKAFEYLKGMQLTSVKFYCCEKLTDKALEHLKGMPLTSVKFSCCQNLTDKALEHLKEMPLTSLKLNFCSGLTDKALEHLKGMPLTSVDFGLCRKITDKALEHLKGMPLTRVDFDHVPESYQQCTRAS